MRIAVVNWSRRRSGGVETYLNGIIPQLINYGHALAFWYEVDKPDDREAITLPNGVPSWCVADIGAQAALQGLRDWQPDLIYAHGLLDPKLEAAVTKIAPAVFFAHSYYGTCISGAKTFKFPVVTPCDRRFGPKCLLHYFPHRCGGLNPLTMAKLYRRQSHRLKLMSSYKAIVTHSDHMREEYVKHGIDSEHIYDLLYYVRQNAPDYQSTISENAGANGLAGETDGTNNIATAPQRDEKLEWHLLFLGRMDLLKGGSMFLSSLPLVTARLRKALRVTFAGDGPQRSSWEKQARLLQEQHPTLQISFTGWLDGAAVDSLLAGCDLLILPSLWPEPFGLVGPEAGLRGVPVAAFGVGGIPNWLIDGLNGHLASGDPPTAEGLAEAIVKCLHDPATHARLGRGAAEMAQKFQMENHLSALIKVFDGVIGEATGIA
jgi:glycosyltransferase involved in cell wall biosynthesis